MNEKLKDKYPKRPNPCKEGNSKGNPFNAKTMKARNNINAGFLAMQSAEANYVTHTAVQSKKGRIKRLMKKIKKEAA